MPGSQEGGFQAFYNREKMMPFMLGVANKIKKPRFISKLRGNSTKGGKKRRLRVRANNIPFIRKVRENDYSLFYLTIALLIILVLAILMVPRFGPGGLILPAVLVPTFLFIIGALKSLLNK